jgi:uncharacterized circularly permuted ATP-grasp superfamily protein
VNSSRGGGSKDTWVLTDPWVAPDPKDSVTDGVVDGAGDAE